MEGWSPGEESVGSGTKKSSISSRGRSHESKEFLHRFSDSGIFTENLDEWLESRFSQDSQVETPFELIDLQKFDYAIEGIHFQQMVRMPSHFYTSPAGINESTTFLAVEDFLHASVKGLWEAFWSQEDPMPFYTASLHSKNSKFYQAEKAIAAGKSAGLCASAIMLKNPRHSHGKFGDVLEFALVKPHDDISDGRTIPLLGEVLFYAIRILLSRGLGRSSSVFILLIDSQNCGVIKVEGDTSKFELDMNNIYDSAADWIRNYANVSISPISKIWNELGNANWGDFGSLHALFAIYNSMIEIAGMPNTSVEDLAADHSTRLQIRRNERQLGFTRTNGSTGLTRLVQKCFSPEIVEVQEESVEEVVRPMKVEIGSVLWFEDSNLQKGYQINEILNDGEMTYYIATPVDDPGKSLFLYVGSHPTQLEPAWEDMKLWYQVQRQTKVLTVMKQKGLSSRYLPQLSGSGRIVHPGQCRKPSSGGNCSHPWCGTPVLVTSPVGQTVADLVRLGRFGSDEALKCCHDCLSALSAASGVGIRHGDIRPENVVYVSNGFRPPYFVLIGWGHAILEDRDRPAMNVHFSSTFALQEGKLCSASDAESLVYLLFFCSGEIPPPELDSVEGALQWRETCWSTRLIQQRLGEISAVLKAFSDYVDSLCGTPYPMDYEIWLRRLKRHIRDENHGKEIEEAASSS
jgi:hypothetical protein